MSAQPTQLSLASKRELLIAWDDDQHRIYPVEELRANCPCATCKALRSDPASPLPAIEPDLTIRTMDPVGSYAYRILFSDGHDTGLYSLELLRRLGTVLPRS